MKKDIDFLKSQNDLLPTDRPPASVCEWAEAKRILPANSPWPGPFRYKRTPYNREICENLNPYSPVINTIVLKARKIGLTTAMENCICYYMFAWPSDQIYSTASESLARQWSQESIMGVIDSMGYRDRLIAQFSNNKNKRAAATAKRIEYIGGKLDIMSSASVEARRQKSVRCIFLDETDGVPEMTTTGEGSYVQILRGHQMSWGARRKFACFSSPTTFEQSAIWPMYQEGDCRKFLIPCPYCGELIELRNTEEEGCGLKAETKGGKITDVFYYCDHCHEPIRNQDKSIFFNDRPHCKKHPGKKIEPARWEPTRKTDDPYSRSYSINALYSPIGALTFRDVYEAKIKAQAGTPDDMRSYINIYMGLPYKDTGQRPKLDRVIELRGDYKSGTIPRDVLFLVMAVDVQRGSEKDEKNPPRLEYEVMGVARNRISYSICYGRFEGEVEEPNSGAWEKLENWFVETVNNFVREDGIKMSIRLIGIDSGYLPETVYRVCEQWSNCYPIKGFQSIYANEKKREKGDLPGNMKRYRAAKFGSSDTHILEVNSNYYKNQLYNRLKIERQPGDEQKFGFCAFPRDYPESYFESLTAEEKRTDGSFHKIREHNEMLDCRVYNFALEDFYLESQVNAWRAYYKAQGLNDVALQQINTIWVLHWLTGNPH